MTFFKKILFLAIVTTVCSMEATQLASSPGKIRTLYNSLETHSITQHLAFYQLYPESSEGKKALDHAWNLLSGQKSSPSTHFTAPPLKSSIVDSIVRLVNKQSDNDSVILTEEELKIINQLAARLPNRRLKGYQAQSEAEVLLLPPEEIDLARGLFLSQLGNSPEGLEKLHSYEAMIDMMALQLLVEVNLTSSPEMKIRAMNRFIFEEMGFRFPPHSLYAKDIDLYTFLPSVLDSRRGVCLGVSILYICLAQRLDLPLEMITPPGHIYVRYRNGDKIINIETTARGIHVDCKEYLSISTRSLQERNIKEVIGLAHFNQASTFWHKNDYAKTLDAYQKAYPYIPDDMLLAELMGYAYLLTGQKEEGEKLLRSTLDHLPEYAINKESMTADYLNGNVNEEGIKAIFKSVDETRSSVLEKKDDLEKVLTAYPNFRAGLFSLAGAWLQLHREGEALEVLERYHKADNSDPTAEYYLAALHAQRHNFNKAWDHLRQAEKLTSLRNHTPKPLKELRKQLSILSPE